MAELEFRISICFSGHRATTGRLLNSDRGDESKRSAFHHISPEIGTRSSEKSAYSRRPTRFAPEWFSFNPLLSGTGIKQASPRYGLDKMARHLEIAEHL